MIIPWQGFVYPYFEGGIYMIGIYRITNEITGEFYIGQSGRMENRLNAHKRRAFNPNHREYDSPLYKSIRKYGIENFRFEILETISLNALEEKWIQKSLKSNPKIFNKNLYPNTNKGINATSSIFNEDDINKIIIALKENKMSNIQIAKKFNCSSSTIDNINNGSSYRQETEKYPIRKYTKSVGANNANSMYTEDEVMQLRKTFVNKTISEMYEESDKRVSRSSFERIVTGRSYGHLPIYKKRTNQWINKESCID